jgi:hypothetical protein
MVPEKIVALKKHFGEMLNKCKLDYHEYQLIRAKFIYR